MVGVVFKAREEECRKQGTVQVVNCKTGCEERLPPHNALVPKATEANNRIGVVRARS